MPLTLDPNAALSPLGNVYQQVTAALAQHFRYAKCKIESLPFVHTEMVAPNARKVVTDGRAVGHKTVGHDPGWGPYDQEYFGITGATYAIMVSTHTNIIHAVYLWEGVDLNKVLAAIRGVIPSGS